MTLIEILVVLTLIGIVMGIVGGNYLGQGEKAKAKAAKIEIEIEQIGQTLDLFKLEVGRYPTTQEGLQALITDRSQSTNRLQHWCIPSAYGATVEFAHVDCQCARSAHESTFPCAFTITLENLR